jgi:signal transduction histidine kinase
MRLALKLAAIPTVGLVLALGVQTAAGVESPPSTWLIAVAAGVVIFAAGTWLVERPLKALTALARRVAHGDYSLRTRITTGGEVGELARELDAMTDRLAASQLKISAERRARTSALEQLRHADRLSTVGKLASSMAHELGTPLNVVAGRARMIETDEGASDGARDNARIIAEQAERMTEIIRELLEFSRRKPLDRRSARIGDVLEHAATLLEPICEDKDIVLEIAGAPEVEAEIDSGKVLQVLTNLLMNAVQAMPDGGRIELSVSREHVDDPPDRRAKAGDYLVIVVDDEGVGIPEDRLPDIFDAFFTTKKEGKGTGLGLSVCHGIVRDHGGWMEVASVVGEGTTFRVYLPEEREG